MKSYGDFLMTTQPNLILEMLKNNIVDIIYPVGSIYISTNDINPFETMGVGTWEKIKDTFLLAAGEIYSRGSTGGEATHVLTIDEMPNHRHTVRSGSTPTSTEGSNTKWGFQDCILYTTEEVKLRNLDSIGYNGGDQAHNNMPPYLAVNMWKRTA